MKTSSLVRYTLLALCFFATQRCTHEADIPSPAVQDPSFGADFLIGNDSIKLYAGKNGYYLNSYYEKSPEGIYVFSGELKRKDCVNCTETIQFGFYDDTLNAIGAININNVLSTGLRKFVDSGGVIFPTRTVAFTTEITGKIYDWKFDGTDKTSAANPIYTFKSNGQHNVCLTIFDSAGTRTVCNTITIGDTKGCNIQYVTNNINGDSASFTATGPHDEYRWNFGDGSPELKTVQPTIFHIFPGHNVYPIAVTEADVNGCSQTFTKYLSISAPDTNTCAFSYAILDSSSVNNLKKVIVNWTNKNGVRYSSKRNIGTQPSSSFLNIIKSESYKTDPAGHKTYKVTGSLQAYVYNSINPNDSLLIKSGKFVIAVAYP